MNKTLKKTNANASTDVDAFAGIKAGCKAGFKLAWQNPEKQMSWSKFASLSMEGDAAAGVGGEFAFKVKFDPNNGGKFLISFKAELVCGVGAEGHLAAVIYPEHVESFVQFIYHKIMQYGFQYLGFIANEAFKSLGNLLTASLLTIEHDTEAILKAGFRAIDDLWLSFRKFFLGGDENRLKHVLRLTYNIISKPERLSCTLPEVKGRLLYLLSDSTMLNDLYNRTFPHSMETGQYFISKEGEAYFYTTLHRLEKAMLLVLSYIQTHGEYQNVMQHMSLEIMTRTSIDESEKRLYNDLGVYGLSKLKALKGCKEKVDDANNKIVYPDNHTGGHVVQNKYLVKEIEKIKV